MERSYRPFTPYLTLPLSNGKEAFKNIINKVMTRLYDYPSPKMEVQICGNVEH